MQRYKDYTVKKKKRMCGIFALLNHHGKLSQSTVEEEFTKGSKRGPEFSQLKSFECNLDLGFHRLAINGLNSNSNQPFLINGISLICNGEIYNYKELYDMMSGSDVKPITDSDCEVIIHLYQQYGIEHTLQLLDGVFAFVLLDMRNVDAPYLYIARDPYGVRPLYRMQTQLASIPNKPVIGFASELKVLSKLCNELNDDLEIGMSEPYEIQQYSPGTYSMMEWRDLQWTSVQQNIRYHSTGFNSVLYPEQDLEIITENIQYYLVRAVHKRCCTTERPIACLLSGGLDSSIITALVQEYQHERGYPPVETYSIGLAGSEDLRYAKIVADHLGTQHTEIVLTEQDFVDAIPEVIRSIESYDTTTVRASIGNWLLGKYISEHSEAKVIFNGDGSDELMGGYLYMNVCPNALEFDRESRRLLRDIHAFDVLRSDKSISSHGLEPRTPFLDRSWVQYFLSIHPDIRNHRYQNQCEKYLVRFAFSSDFYRSSDFYATEAGKPLLPDEILWRRKEAFSDGVSKTSRSLYEIIQEYVDKKEIIRPNHYNHLPPETKEQTYYRQIFDDAYPNHAKVVPYYWMPRYVKAKDASARTLELYAS